MDKEREQSLIAAARKGGRSAAEELFEFYISALYNYLYLQLGNFVDAEDAAQETVLEALKSLERYQEQGSFKAWLFCIAYRQAARSRRRKRIRRFLPGWKELDTDSINDSKPSPVEQAIRNEQSAAVADALRSLTADERSVVMLRMYEDLPFKEIAQIMGCPLNTALSRMHSAVRKLRVVLQKSTHEPEDPQ